MRHPRHLVFALAVSTAIALAPTVAAASASSASPSPSGASIATTGTPGGVPACASCHGAQGEGNAIAGFPRLAGTGADYLTSQLAAFANGTRHNAVMQPIASMMSADERAAVAQYFSSLPAPADIRSDDTPDASPTDRGAWLATRGRWQDSLPACVQCHGSGGTGVGSVFPPLAGQSADYIRNQLHGWKDSTRPPGPLGLMQNVASKLSDADIDAVADYYAQRPSAPAHSR